MYSVVLMAALTTAPEAPNCWFKHGHGGCHGCHGWGGCHGCNGCGGGCYGCGGCYGGYGSGWGYAPSPWNGWSSCYGCYGFYGCGGSCFGTPYAPQTRPAEGIPAPMKEEEKKKEEGAAAKLTIELPENAKLFVDDQPIQATGTRTFSTPKLAKGQAYYYMVRVEVVREGKTYSDTQRIIVRAGDTAKADFLALGKQPATDRAVASAEE
jgi:uncharacterized protein (TIGR03000 family)